MARGATGQPVRSRGVLHRPPRRTRVRLVEQYTRQLGGKLRELRFYTGGSGEAIRLTYYIASGRRIILLTVFRKQRQRERAEIKRAHLAMDRCIAEGHTAGDDDV